MGREKCKQRSKMARGYGIFKVKNLEGHNDLHSSSLEPWSFLNYQEIKSDKILIIQICNAKHESKPTKYVYQMLKTIHP